MKTSVFKTITLPIAWRCDVQGLDPILFEMPSCKEQSGSAKQRGLGQIWTQQASHPMGAISPHTPWVPSARHMGLWELYGCMEMGPRMGLCCTALHPWGTAVVAAVLLLSRCRRQQGWHTGGFVPTGRSNMLQKWR